MEVVCMARGAGKTRYLIEQSAKNQIPIAVAYEKQVNHIRHMAEELGYNIPAPFVATPMSCRYARKYYIDEAMVVLQKLLGGTPVLATLSEKD